MALTSTALALLTRRTSNGALSQLAIVATVAGKAIAAAQLSPGNVRAQTDDETGGYDDPDSPEVEEGVCESQSVEGAETVVAAWPGRVREIFCYRGPEDCPPNAPPSDHCHGKAIDFMISDAGGVSELT